MKKILVLGAGLVAKPLVHYLLDNGFYVKVASLFVEDAKTLVGSHKNGISHKLDVQNEDELEVLIKKYDLVVSLLPYVFHPKIAKICLSQKKHLVTTSYVSGDMRAMDKEAKKNGLLFLNEVGLDPGVDHMSAMKIINDVKAKGGKVVSFKSYCGGLPAPDANDNPFGYKFSWSPKGVLMAGLNSGRYLESGHEINISNKDLFLRTFPLIIENLGEFEAYTNRDSIPYIDVYDIKEIQTFFRGTLRYKGWCETIKAIVELGLLNDKIINYPGSTMKDFIAGVIKTDTNKLIEKVAEKIGVPKTSDIILRLSWLGLFSDNKLEATGKSPIDTLTDIMLEKMCYKQNERDMIVLYHDIAAEYKKGVKEKIISKMVVLGDPKLGSAMSRTVGLPAAIAVKLILEGKINLTGVHIPVLKELYEPILEELSSIGVAFTESKENI